jgi:UPF0271 protein
MTDRPPSIDLNADLGEGCPWDELLLDRVTSACVCCGAHAGDRDTSLRTLRWAQERGVAAGAHPGYADRDGFGRVERTVSTAEVEAIVMSQVQELAKLAGSLGSRLHFLKPHGALYNQAQRDPEVARGVLHAARALELPVLGQPASTLAALAESLGVRLIREGFADRRYRPDGRLMPRAEPGAILEDPAEVEAQVVRLVQQGIDTLCIHGDDPRSVALADHVRTVLCRVEIPLRSWL